MCATAKLRIVNKHHPFLFLISYLGSCILNIIPLHFASKAQRIQIYIQISSQNHVRKKKKKPKQRERKNGKPSITMIYSSKFLVSVRFLCKRDLHLYFRRSSIQQEYGWARQRKSSFGGFWIEIDIGQLQIQIVLWQKYTSLGKFSQKPKNPWYRNHSKSRWSRVRIMSIWDAG